MNSVSNSQYFDFIGTAAVAECTLNPSALSERLDEATGKLNMSFGDRIAVTFYRLLGALGFNTASKVQGVVWNYFNAAYNKNTYSGRESKDCGPSLDAIRVSAKNAKSSLGSSPSIASVRSAYLPKASQALDPSAYQEGDLGSIRAFDTSSVATASLDEDDALPTSEELAFEKQMRAQLDKALGKPATLKAPQLDLPQDLPGLGNVVQSPDNPYADILPDLPGIKN